MDIFQKAVQYFGTTSDFREAGYILPDGTMLDFSDKQNGGLPGMRLLDHREVAEILDLPQTEALITFMNSGCIRVMPECPGLDISIYPTKKQIDVIRRFVDYYRGDVCIDISDKKGNIVTTFEYTEKTSSSRIIFDIRTVFQQREMFAESV
jgi:hypothetical protein